MGAFALACLPTRAEAKASSAFTRLAGVDSVIEQAIADGNIPGAVLVVGHDRAVVYLSLIHI